MKKTFTILLAMALLLCVTVLSGCSSGKDPGTPPAEVINPSSDSASDSDNAQNSASGFDGTMITNATTVKVGRDGNKAYSVDMPNIAAVNTMLGYLSSSEMMFPTYTYDETGGFVAQSIRGSYTRENETTVQNVKCGELYLFSDGQLRLYFKDVDGVNITATPVGTFADSGDLTEAVTNAYESNRGDTWNVDVYFRISKNAN